MKDVFLPYYAAYCVTQYALGKMDGVRITIHAHALTHEITEDQIRAALTQGAVEKRVRRRDAKADPPRWGVIGFDNQAQPLELVAVELLSGDVLIIHANYLTRGFTEEMRKTP